MHATMSCLFYKKQLEDFVGVAVYESDDKIPVLEMERLNREVDRAFESIDDKNAITEYLASAA
jgi:hypothetical protein